VVAVTGAVNAVTGAVTAETWDRDPALDVTGFVPAVIAVAGCRVLANRPGHVLLATLGSLAHVTLACATAMRVTCRYALPNCTRCIAVGCVAGHVREMTASTILLRVDLEAPMVVKSQSMAERAP
jgi:hypothetical protein